MPDQVCLITNPIWVVKTRLQLQRAGGVRAPAAAAAVAARAGARRAAAGRVAKVGAVSGGPYRGAADAVAQIAREEGFRGFYRGLVPSLLLVRAGVSPSPAAQQGLRHAVGQETAEETVHL